MGTENVSSKSRHCENMKKFIRTIEDFTCEHCGTEVSGNGYTNHCSKCLWSKHVDVNPGDRMEKCGGLMRPLSVETKSGETTILQHCLVCGFERKNGFGQGDNFEALLALSAYSKELS